MRSITESVKQLIIINVIFFIGSQVSGGLSYDLLALHYFENDKFLISQLITHMFMHGSVSHILFNMFGLWMFGSPLEQMWGKKKFLYFYFSAGLGAAGLQLLANYLEIQSVFSVLNLSGVSFNSFNDILNNGSYDINILNYVDKNDLTNAYSLFNTTLVGASGAIYGVLVAFAFLFPNSELMLIFLPIPIKAKYFVPAIILMDLFSAFTGVSIFSPSNTAFYAHVGGALTGFIMLCYWKKNQFNDNRWN
ncbi:MAG: rhomboid family intramembrane serine protease [Bacteroidetes bacterium]|jgi:membrane associated rhomboid family serine protease|nr:MAG: protease [Cryomorphaceae bacterium BACL29 MAG-121220-bin8]MDA0758147.1 rhomboid family intramembrane serine protease [Bacteroidota bacterium]MDA1019531.1 rhomboid family intramembrane serine protease [Bacteroidota bacterium]